MLIVLLISSCSLHTASQVSDAESAVEEGIAVSSLASVRMDNKVIDRLTANIESGAYPNLHSLLIAKEGRLVYEKYFTGDDQYWGQKMKQVEHSAYTLHDVRSISKSVVSACIGIALDQGRISSIDQPIFDYFPEYHYLLVHGKEAVTIRHLLTMTSGFAWDEDVSHTNKENTEMQMIFSEDPVAFVLGRTLVSRPGSTWNYNGGCTQILAAILQKTTGLSVDKFAEKYLFKHLEIEHYEWVTLPNAGIPAAASGLRLRTRDLLKFGLLYRNNGRVGKRQLIQENWVTESLKKQIDRPDGRGGYGFQFWTWTDYVLGSQVQIAAASGNGGQRIYFDRENDLLVLTTAGNYNNAQSEQTNYRLVKDYIYPAVLELDDSAVRE